MTRLSGVLAAGMALTMALASCAGSDDDGGGSSSDVTSVKIGFMGDLTGENSAIVIPPRDGAKLAIDEYNATNPDAKIELVEYDSQGKRRPGHCRWSARPSSQDKIVGADRPGVLRRVQGRRPDAGAGRRSRASRRRRPTPAWPRTAGSTGTASSRTTTTRARASRTSWSRRRARRRPSWSATTRSTASAWPTRSRPRSRRKGVTVERDKFAQDASDYSVDGGQGEGGQAGRRSSSAATTPRAAGCSSSCATAA